MSPPSGMHEDAVLACVGLVGRAGANGFELGWTCPHVPGEPDDHSCPDVTWHASASYKGARIITDEHRSPSTAALALAERLLRGATCRCRRAVVLVDQADGCRWRLMGQTWEPGCDAPPIRMPDGTRGDYAAIQRALAQAPVNRAERRAARKRGTTSA